MSAFKTPYLPTGLWEDLKGLDQDRNLGKQYHDSALGISFKELHEEDSDPHPAWGPEDEVPISKKDIKSIFNRLTEVFGFQTDSSKNIFEYMMKMLDSRAARMSPLNALRSLHGDYIGGPNANFRKWYFSSEMDLDDAYRWENVKKNGTIKKSETRVHDIEHAEEQWYKNMLRLSAQDYASQIALFLLCWGEANNLRFMPECLCFIFKCCNDYYFSIEGSSFVAATPFLDHVITPLYLTYRSQCYREIDGKLTYNDKDHDNTIGYDDMNQIFWYRSGIERIVLKNKTKLTSLDMQKRYGSLNEVDWSKVFFKTYREKRTWLHVLVNFNRVLIIHFSMFWYYTSYNSPTLYTSNYQISKDNKPPTQTVLTIMALAGAIACILSTFGVLLELWFVPRKWDGAQPVFQRLVLLILMLCLNAGPTAYLLYFFELNSQSTTGLAIATVQFAISAITVLYLSITPSAKLFNSRLTGRKSLASTNFTGNFYQLKGTDKMASFGLWTAIFLSKFIESYFFLTLSLKDPVRELSVMRMNRCVGDQWFRTWLCDYQPTIVLGLIMTLDFILFYLDTYLWYIIWNTLFSVFRSFYLGASIWTPWRNIFSRLPKRIYSKVLVTSNNKKSAHKYQVSTIWNSIIISMYREHILCLEQVQKLIYQFAVSPNDDEETVLREPTFFVSQEDDSLKSSLFYENSEAQRRITFFAQSLSTPMPDIGEVNNMPSFTVLIPHYGEKILLTLKEIIREEDKFSHVTMLEYLKQLHDSEWDNFVRDSKQMAEENEDKSGNSFESHSSKEKFDDLPYQSVGFKDATDEYIVRTRVWASMRSQTLYRTVSGFMNYSRAIKLLYHLENRKENDDVGDENLQKIHHMANRKFRIISSMQRYKHFTEDERSSTEYLLRAYPELQIAFIDEEMDTTTGSVVYFSALIDGTCPILENGEREPKFKIRLSGYPILGDGKSDNQNHAVIFTRGEYIQLIDANQDNYVEECLKIRNVLAEFEEQHFTDPYSHESRKTLNLNTVAIIGTREYIFSENVGILGDVAAGKEQTFGTLFSRTLAQIGGKLHYGHPDFLNAIFMTTRGGVSKAQRGLHLNEDIYAGMTAVIRGGRIKHCEYIQCGKGRDLGFSSILNFITKIGAGMGEQVLSREYFYLGTQLPLDRFLSFYYAHAGFHLNNVCIILSIQFFLLVGINLAALTNDSTICEYDKHRPITDPRRPSNCYNFIPVVQWLERCIYSILLVLLISFVPLGVQELTERGVYKSVTRLGKHFMSLSPLFEVFVCKIYAQSLISDISIGGAQYIATGRGFATKRESFSSLYARFAVETLNYGAYSLLFVIYISVSLWKISFIYLWLTVVGLLISPYLYNPNQFAWNDFFIDYKDYLKWLFRGNSRSRDASWIGYTKIGRSRYTGLKLKLKLHYGEEDVKFTSEVKPSRYNIIATIIMPDILNTLLVGCAFLFANAQNESKNSLPGNSVLRILVISASPIAVNMVILLVFFVISVVLGPLFCCIFGKFPSFIAAFVHILALIAHITSIEFLWLLQNFNFLRTVLGFALSALIQKIFLQLINTILLSREFRHSKSNRAWWSGKWVTSGLGWRIITEPIREYFCKVTEVTYFAADIIIGHTIFYLQIPILIIPLANTWHSMMLLWLKHGSQLRQRVLSKKERKKRQLAVCSYFLVFVIGFLVVAGLFVLPLMAVKVLKVEVNDYFPDYLEFLRQPVPHTFGKKGLHKNLIKNY